MSVLLLFIGIIFLVVGICSIIGGLTVSRFDFGRGKIMKYNDIHEKFERNDFLEAFISTYSMMGGIILLFIGVLLITIPEYYITYNGVYKIDKRNKISNMDDILKSDSLYSYAFIFGPFSKKSNFSYTIDMKIKQIDLW